MLKIYISNFRHLIIFIYVKNILQRSTFVLIHLNIPITVALDHLLHSSLKLLNTDSFLLEEKLLEMELRWKGICPQWETESLLVCNNNNPVIIRRAEIISTFQVFS